MSDDVLTVPAKRLGWLDQPDFCPRCFYIKHALNWTVPWQIPMPIYNTLDRAQKAFVTGRIDEGGELPEWLSSIGKVVGWIDPPSHGSFFHISSEHDVKVRGIADLILILEDGRLAIVDLKTANAKCAEDMLLPTYIIQQSAYALAAEYQGLGEVASASLLYMTATTGEDISLKPASGQAGDMVVPFKATHYQLPLVPDRVEDLCGRYRELCEMTEMPEGREGCMACVLTDLIHRAYADPQSNPAITAMAAEHGCCLRELFAQIGMAR